MKKILYLWVFNLLFISCSTITKKVVVNGEIDAHNNLLTPLLSGIKEFTLDEETSSASIKYLQYIDMDGVQYFSYLNSYNHSIYFLDYDTSDELFRIEYNKKDRRPLKDVIRGYCYLNRDSIFLYSHSVGSGMLYGVDYENNLFVKFPLIRNSYIEKGYIYPSPWCRTWSPLKKWRNKIISIGFFAGEFSMETPQNRPVVIIGDINNKTLDYAVNYPPQYSEYNWGGSFAYRLPFYDINKDNIVISFPAHHYLIAHSLVTGVETEGYAGCSAISEIESYSKPKDCLIDGDDVVDWYYKTPSYEGIYYDRYKDCYYRIAKLPVPDSCYTEGEYNFKPTVVIVLDSELNYIGESYLPSDLKYRTMNCFVSRDGLNIEVLTDDEDKIIFYQYKFTK